MFLCSRVLSFSPEANLGSRSFRLFCITSNDLQLPLSSRMFSKLKFFSKYLPLILLTSHLYWVDLFCCLQISRVDYVNCQCYKQIIHQARTQDSPFRGGDQAQRRPMDSSVTAIKQSIYDCVNNLIAQHEQQPEHLENIFQVSNYVLAEWSRSIASRVVVQRSWFESFQYIEAP